MIKEAIEKIVTLANANAIMMDGRSYTDKPVHPVKEPVPEPVEFATLSGVVDYVRANIDTIDLKGVFIHVHGPTDVFLRSRFEGSFKQRNIYVKASVRWPSFSDHYMSIEKTIITLQTHFVRTDELSKLLAIVGNIKEEAIRTNIDDGVSQSVTVKSGVSLAQSVAIPNPIKLKPYQTFIEIDQPEEFYLFRMRKESSGPECSLYEVSGGMWKIEAITRIKEFFNKELPGVIVLA